jgi:mRNA interferase MazF
VTFEAFEVVRVPFPFTDKGRTKTRPALILSDHAEFGDKVGHSIMAMITSSHHAPWPHDVAITDLEAAGLPSPSVVRWKLFTLDHRLVLGPLGRLSPADVAAVETARGRVFREP